jgi:rhamnogalacturonyl hydrolase YesR
MSKFFILLLFVPGFLVSSPLFCQPYAKSKWSGNSGKSAELYRSLTFDGSWCWFSDPRAVRFKGTKDNTYTGYIDSYGDVSISSMDNLTGKIETSVIYDGLQIDDHDNPSILIDPSGTIYVFFNKHGGPHPLYFTRSLKPENISGWTEIRRLELNDKELYKGFGDTYSYTNPVMLSEENNRIYIFWRGIDNKPNYSFSDDLGETWSKGRIFILPERIYDMRRPYLKVYSDGKSIIHFAFTDGHPNVEKENSIYYMYYRKGAIYKANGQQITRLGEKAVHPGETDIVYDATTTGQKAWIWDVAMDGQGKPVLVYVKFPNDTIHIYCYAGWNGNKWINTELVNAGKWFPQTLPGTKETEMNYSGGMNIDKENTNVVYMSVNRDSIFEIERWERSERGGTWSISPLTAGSSRDNVRPFAVRNAYGNEGVQVLWMSNIYYIHYNRRYETSSGYHSSIKTSLEISEVPDPLNPAGILNIMHRLADWQLSNPVPANRDRLNWLWGAFYAGLMDFYKTTGEDRYLNEIINLGQSRNWKILNDIYHADRHAISQSFAEIYMMKKDPVMLEKIRWALDMHIDRTAKPDVRYKDNPNYRFEWWSWCDVLFMAPPAFARIYAATGDKKYLEYLNKYWWITSDHLYSKEDSLYYRDDQYIGQMTENGKKIFWARGNGWVIAGITRVLDYMPADDPGRKALENQFMEMASRLVSLTNDQGLWTASLLDPAILPTGESSGSAFITYALAWGVNHGFLNKDRYAPVILKAWSALCKNVNAEGRLGFVQQVSGSPEPFYENQSQVYASGAFLMAGCQVLKMVN